MAHATEADIKITKTYDKLNKMLKQLEIIYSEMNYSDEYLQKSKEYTYKAQQEIGFAINNILRYWFGN